MGLAGLFIPVLWVCSTRGRQSQRDGYHWGKNFQQLCSGQAHTYSGMDTCMHLKNSLISTTSISHPICYYASSHPSQALNYHTACSFFRISSCGESVFQIHRQHGHQLHRMYVILQIETMTCESLFPISFPPLHRQSQTSTTWATGKCQSPLTAKFLTSEDQPIRGDKASLTFHPVEGSVTNTPAGT